MNLYVIKYNNYYNRKVLIENSLSDYLSEEFYDGLHIDNISFNPADDIKTYQIVDFEPVGDYVILTDVSVSGEGDQQVITETINSRWFILEAKREKTGQYLLTLKHDVIADSYNDIINAPMYIERAPLDDNDPYIFNKERIPLNQIKNSETLLKDETQSAWIVGYIPRNAFSSSTTITADAPSSSNADVTVAGISNWEFYQFCNLAPNPQSAVFIDTSDLTFNVYAMGGELYKYKFSFKAGGPVSTGWSATYYGTVYTDIVTGASMYVPLNQYPNEPAYLTQYDCYCLAQNSNTSVARTRLSYIYGQFSQNDFADLSTYIGNDFNSITAAQAEQLEALNGKVILDTSTDIAYTITVTKNSSPQGSLISINQNSQAYQLMSSKLNGAAIWDLTSDSSGKTASPVSFKASSMNAGEYTITLSQFQQGQLSVTIDSTRGHPTDVPYDMFLIPYGAIRMKDGNDIFTINPNYSLAIANAIGLALGDSVYDLQLLPYFPYEADITSGGDIDISALGFKDMVTLNNQIVNVVIWSTKSNFVKTINFPINIENPKIESQTDLYRFTSPNYATSFDFNAAMNGGLTFVKACCTYKPFNPFIQIIPQFNDLYGGDFNDNRGLVCGGDFSLPQITSQWANYELNHKNSLEIFNSRVSTLTESGVNRENAIATVISTTMGDVDQAEQIANMIASPNGLANSSTLAINNKIFPFVEYYSCTDIEKDALSNKILYEGMSVGRIGLISDFISSVTGTKFIRCRPIWLPINNKDSHHLDEINKELRRGVYM